MLGGAATHFALAASFFDEVRAVGPVGDDFDEESWRDPAHARHGDRRRRARRGRQDLLLEGRLLGRPQRARDAGHRPQRLRVTSSPKLSQASQDADVLFLANIQPDLQLDVREQCANARFVAMDSMNLWIDIANALAAQGHRRRVDCLILNDEELEQLTEKPTLAAGGARGPLVGPDGRRRQARQVRRGALHRRRLLRAARLSAGRGHRPDRRRRHVRRRLRRLRRRAPRRGDRPRPPQRARWPTARRWPPTTSRSSAPSASSA